MKSSSISLLSRSFLVAAGLVLGASALQAQTPAALHLAYGDSRSTALPDATHKLVVRDLHEDHYHNFTANNGTDPLGHVPMPFVINPGGPASAISFAGMDVSPDAGENFKFDSTTRADGPLATLELQLEVVSISGAGFRIGIFEWHEDHFHNEGYLTAGDTFSLEYDGWYELRLTFDAGTAPGDYSAVFRLVDAQTGVTPYGTSNDFTIHAQAIPEPSTVVLLAGVGGVALFSRLRRSARRVKNA